MSSNHDAARGSGQVQPTKRTALWLLSVLAVVLAACGSSVSTSGGASRNPPASATTTPGTTVSNPGISRPLRR